MATALAIVLLVCPTKSAAQHNSRHIDDEVNAIYVEADKNRYTEKGLQLTEQAYELAVRKGDKKGQCVVLCTPIFYYNKLRDTKGVKAAVDRVKKVAKRNNCQTYYYFAWFKWIEYSSNEGNLLLALQEAQKLNDEVRKEKVIDHYAIATSYRSLANVYYHRFDYDKAAEYFRKTLDYFKEHLPNQDRSIIYINLVDYYIQKNDYVRARDLIDEAISVNKYPQNLKIIYVMKAIISYSLGDKETFREYYAKTSKLIRERGETSVFWLPMMEVMKCILDGDLAKARQEAGKARYEVMKYKCERLIARAENNSSAVSDISDKLINLYTKDFSDIHAKDMYQLDKSVNDMQFKADNLRLELELATSNSVNERLERERLLAQSKMKDLEISNDILKINELKVSDSLGRAKLIMREKDLVAQKNRVMQEEQAHKMHTTIYALTVAFLVALLTHAGFSRRNKLKLIAKLRQSNADLEVAKEKAEESSRMKTMFVQNVSHEIRTPLNAIVGFTDLLLDPDMELGDEDRQEFGKIIHTNTDLLTSLVNDVLALSDLQSGKTKLNVAPCRCNDMCRICIETVLHRKPDGVTLDFTTDVEDSFTIDSDQHRLSQVIINFLTNAEKYTQEGSIILDCSARKDPGSVVFSVTDTGCGIPLDKQDQIFERFEKLDEFHQGMGLGLNICHYIAEMFHYKIGIDKNYTDGARFYIAIPQEPAASSPA